MIKSLLSKAKKKSVNMLVVLGLVLGQASGALLLAPHTAMAATSNTSNMYVAAKVSNPQQFFAYVKAGESLNLNMVTVRGNSSADPSTITITVKDAAGNQIYTNGGFAASATMGETVANANVTGGTPGVWTVTLTSSAVERALDWRLNVMSGGTVKDGRVWADTLYITQGTSDVANVSIYGVSDAGYQYKLDLKEYNGYSSTIICDAVGLVKSASDNTPLNESVDGNGFRDTSVGRYRMFFEKPDPSLPVSGPSAAGNVTILPPPIESKGTPVASMEGFTANNTDVKSGYFTVKLDPDFAGSFKLQVDTNNNGSYSDAVDRTITAVAPGGAGNASLKIPFNGLDGQGNQISAADAISAKIIVGELGSFYVTMGDVELLGGLTITQLNGSSQGNTKVYWNDSKLDTTDIKGSIPSPLDATAGVNSNTASGVHGWASETWPTINGGTWGDNRTIETWTFATYTASAEEQALMEETIPGASNVVYGDSEGPLTPQKLVGLAHSTDPDVVPDATQLATINDAIAAGKVGPYPMTFTSPDGSKINIIVTLGNGGGGTIDDPTTTPNEATDHIIANNFIYPDPSGPISPDQAKALGQTQAKDKDGKPINIADLDVNPTQLAAINDAIAAGKVGPYPLTYVAPDGSEAKITVTLTNKGGGTPSTDGPTAPKFDGSDRIGANDFIRGDSQGPISEDLAKNLAKTVAQDKNGNVIDPANLTVDPTQLAAINDAIAAGKIGGMPLTFTTPDGTKAEITVTLTNSGAGTPDDPATPADEGTSIIGANDFYHGDDQGQITPAQAKVWGGVVAKDATGNPIDPSKLTVDPAQLAAINKAVVAGKVGPYPLTYTAPDGTHTTITVTLGNHGGGTPDDPATPANEATAQIIANNFTYGDPEGPITIDQAKELGEVQAKDKNGDPVALADLTVDPTQLTAINDAIAAGKVGPFPLTYTAPDGTPTTITVTLTNSSSGTPSTSGPLKPNFDGTDRIGANNFIRGDSQGPLSPDQAKAYAKVSAKDKEGNVIDYSKLSADPTQLAAINKAIAAGKVGDMPLTFTTPDGTATSIVVTLTNSGAGKADDPKTPANDGTSIIGANNFYRGTDQGPLSPDDARGFSKVKAMDKDGNLIPVADLTPDAAQLAAINKAIAAGKTGPYPLKFKAPDGTTTTITVTLGNHGAGRADDPSTPENEATDNIIGNDFSQPTKSAPLTIKDALNLGSVVARDADGNPIPASKLKVDQAQLDAINAAKAAGQTGSFPLTFTTPDGTQITIMVTLTPLPPVPPVTPVKAVKALIGPRTGDSGSINAIIAFVLAGLLLGASVVFKRREGYNKA